MEISGIIGHAAILKILSSSAANPAPAYLFIGASHLGKRTIAARFITALLGLPPGASFSSHPDFAQLEPEEGKVLVSVEQVRILREKVSLRPMHAPRVVAYLPFADRLNEAGMNALLKVVEEPPAGAVFVMVAEDLSRIPGTIRSRCVVLPFDIASKTEIMEALGERGMAPSEAERRAPMSRGKPGIALSEEPEAGESTTLKRLFSASSLGASLAAIEDMSKFCESTEDSQAAWRSLLAEGMEKARELFVQDPTRALVLGTAFVTAWRQVGSPVSPRFALEAGALRLAKNGDPLRGLFPGHLPQPLSLVY